MEDEDSVIPIIIVDTKEDANTDEYMQKMKAYDTGILLLSDKAIIVSKALTNEEILRYSGVFTLNIEGKEEFLNLISLENMIPLYIVFVITIVIYLLIVYVLSNVIDAVVLGALGYLFARIVKLRLKYKATFNIGTYALTLPIILNLIYIVVNTFTGFEIRYFQWMYTSISYIYVAVAILMIKTEIINQRIQLIKLKEIQEQVSKEAEEKGEDEPKEEKEENKKQEEDEKEEKKRTGEEPEGSNA